MSDSRAYLKSAGQVRWERLNSLVGLSRVKLCPHQAEHGPLLAPADNQEEREGQRDVWHDVLDSS